MTLKKTASNDSAAPGRRLRVAGIIVQPLLMWDDGEELTEGPPTSPRTLSPGQCRAFLDQLPDSLEALALTEGTEGP